MIQRAVLSFVTVLIGLFAAFSVFDDVVIAVDNLYLNTQAACNFGSDVDPNRMLRFTYDSDSRNSRSYLFKDLTPMDWELNGFNLVEGAGQLCAPAVSIPGETLYWGSDGETRFTVTAASEIQRGVGLISEGSGSNVAVVPRTARSMEWADPPTVFLAQQPLVQLLASITGLGLPLGAMGAVVMFGNAALSNTFGGGEGQIVAIIAVVVMVLITIEVFGQFVVYLGAAFETVDGDRFLVYAEGLGALGETISSFWGILLIAGLLGIGFMLFRNYRGNASFGFSNGGNRGSMRGGI